MRAGVERPIQLDPPVAADPETVRVMTIHQVRETDVDHHGAAPQ